MAPVSLQPRHILMMVAGVQKRKEITSLFFKSLLCQVYYYLISQSKSHDQVQNQHGRIPPKHMDRAGRENWGHKYNLPYTVNTSFKDF